MRRQDPLRQALATHPELLTTEVAVSDTECVRLGTHRPLRLERVNERTADAARTVIRAALTERFGTLREKLLVDVNGLPGTYTGEWIMLTAWTRAVKKRARGRSRPKGAAWPAWAA